MKIGILTHHYVKNYGAFLQMKGMCETLRALYPDAEIQVVNYVNQKHWRKNIIHVLHFKFGVDTHRTFVGRVKQLAVFTKYERSIPRSKRIRNPADLKRLELDLLVLGSDEIWSLCGSGYHPMKFGTGLEPIHMVAYAPSVGAVTESTAIPEEIMPGVNQISRISGRDDETIKFVKRVTGREAVKMLDPTFLYDFDVDIEKEGIRPEPYRYILIYDCKLTDEMAGQLRSYADQHGYKILGAGDYKPWYDEGKISLTPYEWVSLFRNAEKVVTGTFHGTVFSIKYNKDLLCYPTEKNRINKISSLLSDMGMSDRMLALGDETDFIALLDGRADYGFANAYISRKQTEAVKFLLGEDS